MATKNESGDETEYTPGQLLAMDEDTARSTLTVDQYERWEKLKDLDKRADETKAKWKAEAEEVEDLIIHADTEQLGTSVEIYGNDLIVRVNPEDRKLQQTSQKLEDEFGDDDRDVDDVGEEELETLTKYTKTLIDRAIVEWDGVDWKELPKPTRMEKLETARERWGVDGLLLAWMDIATAIGDDREERMEAVESFRGA